MSSTVQFVEIGTNDRNLRSNTLCGRVTANKPGIRNKRLIPDYYNAEAKLLSVTLDTPNMIKFLQTQNLHLLTKVDNDDFRIQSIGQRIPNSTRCSAIRKAWADPIITPENKVELVFLALFNSNIQNDGLVLGDDESRAVVVDAAGRISTLMEDISDLNGDLESDPPIAANRNIMWHLLVDLSGDLVRVFQQFLSINRDPKRVTKGTTLGVEASLINNSKNLANMSYNNPLAPTWIVQKIYSDSTNLQGSIVQFLPWKFEGGQSTSGIFEEGASASNLITAIKELLPHFKNSEIPIEEIPDVITFGMKEWYNACPSSVRSLRARTPNSKRFISTLGLKIMLLTTVLVYVTRGGDKSNGFQSKLHELFNNHFKTYRSVTGQYLNNSSKKMTPDKFFTESTYFGDSRFNSGAANSQQIVQQLLAVWENIEEKP